MSDMKVREPGNSYYPRIPMIGPFVGSVTDEIAARK